MKQGEADKKRHFDSSRGTFPECSGFKLLQSGVSDNVGGVKQALGALRRAVTEERHFSNRECGTPNNRLGSSHPFTRLSDGLINVNSALNQIVNVEGVTRMDGTLFAEEVEGIENQSGAETEGLVTSVTGNPATSLGLLVDDGTGNGMDDTKVGPALRRT